MASRSFALSCYFLHLLLLNSMISGIDGEHAERGGKLEDLVEFSRGNSLKLLRTKRQTKSDIENLYNSWVNQAKPSERVAFIKSLVETMNYGKPEGYNVLVFNMNESYTNGLKGIIFFRQFEHCFHGTNYQIGTWVFKCGKFTNSGDTNSSNWAYTGNYINIDAGSGVIFMHPECDYLPYRQSNYYKLNGKNYPHANIRQLSNVDTLEECAITTTELDENVAVYDHAGKICHIKATQPTGITYERNGTRLGNYELTRHNAAAARDTSTFQEWIDSGRCDAIHTLRNGTHLCKVYPADEYTMLVRRRFELPPIFSSRSADQVRTVKVETTTPVSEELNSKPSAPVPESRYRLNEAGCGRVFVDYIIGGIEVNPKHYPWMVAIVSNEVSGPKRCGGSLITRRHILTAAHCVVESYPRQLKVRLGNYHFSPEANGLVSTDLAIDQVRVHDMFNHATKFADLAILRLKQPLRSNNHYKTICIPQNRQSFERTNATVIGYGYLAFGDRNLSPNLRGANVTIRECPYTYPNSEASNYLCAIGNNGADACQGDSGGPLMVSAPDSSQTLVGIVSHGIGCGTVSYPGIYTNVSMYLDWILENTMW